MKKNLLLTAFLFSIAMIGQQKIDRKALVTRHNVKTPPSTLWPPCLSGMVLLPLPLMPLDCKLFPRNIKKEFRWERNLNGVGTVIKHQ